MRGRNEGSGFRADDHVIGGATGESIAFSSFSYPSSSSSSSYYPSSSSSSARFVGGGPIFAIRSAGVVNVEMTASFIQLYLVNGGHLST